MEAPGMAPDGDSKLHTQSQGMDETQAPKRDSDSLFLGDDEDAEKKSDQSSKRVKTTHDTPDIVLNELLINEDGKVAPYDAPTMERRPHLAIYHPSFKIAEDMIAKICKDFLGAVDEVKNSGYVSDEIDCICETAVKRYISMLHRYPSVKPVACLGPAGVGKSSGMNCLLNQPGAAHESDSAHRGTNLVHEFSASYMQQTALYQVGAPYLREGQVKKVVEKHCRNIFAFLEHFEEFEKDEVSDLQKKHDTGIEFFRILLCNHTQFSTNEDAEEYFESKLKGSERDTVEELKNGIEEFKKTRGLVDCYEQHEAESVKELAEIFRKVSRVPKTSGMSPARPHPWPLISKILIHQDNDVLNAGVVLGDTPGVGDSNQSVVDSTSKYVRKAGTVLVFESFKRIAESESLDANLRECLRLGKGNDTHLIVTMIDGQKIKPEDRDELSEPDRKKLQAAEEVVVSLKAEEKFTKQQKSVALDKANFDDLRRLESDLEDMPVKIALAEARVIQVAIEIRTRDVANELRGKLRKLARSRNGPDLPVHFVSNTQYQIHLAGYEAKKPPTLDVEGTGIPGVRRMLYTIPARGKSTTLARICRNVLPSIFGSISGILTKSRLERKQEVEKEITGVMKNISGLVEDVVNEIKGAFDSQVLMVIHRNKNSWETKAERMAVGWGDYKSMTLMAFCRRSGVWRPQKGQDNISWNEKIVGIMVEKLADGFNEFEDELLSIETSFASDVAELFKDLETKLDECQDFQGVAGAKKFYQVIHMTRDAVLRDQETTFSNLRARLSGIRYSCLFDEGSYVSKAMQSTYEQCLLIANPDHKPVNTTTGRKKYQKKSTIHPRRVDALRQKLKGAGEEPSIFAEVGKAASKAFEEVMINWEKEECTPDLENGYQQIIEDFNQRFVVKEEVKNEGDEEAIEKLKEAADQALQFVEGPLKDHLGRCEAYEKAGGM